jgi:hypothetical protein
MNKKMSQEQKVLVSSETHGMIIEQYCPFARYPRNKGLFQIQEVNMQRRKAVIYKGEIKNVICEDFNPETKKCISDSNNLEDKRCFLFS